MCLRLLSLDIEKRFVGGPGMMKPLEAEHDERLGC
jgi:hypothetical protein